MTAGEAPSADTSPSGKNIHTTPDELVDMLNNYAAKILAKSETNALPAESVRRKALKIKELITARTGEMSGAFISWMDDMQPVAEKVFGINLEEEKIGKLIDYSPTVFPGIFGRTRVISTDEMLGPTISLDLAAGDALHG